MVKIRGLILCEADRSDISFISSEIRVYIQWLGKSHMDNRKKEKALNNKTAKRSFKEILSRKQTTGEEIANSITHGVGAPVEGIHLVL